MNNGYKVKAVVFDWAGTTVDYGSLAPVGTMIEVFARREVEVTDEQVRRFMGMPKWEHVRAVLEIPEVSAQWERRMGRRSTRNDVDLLFTDLECVLGDVLPDYAAPLPGVVDAVERLRSAGLRIGSCTGYSEEMMDVLVPAAAARGYRPDEVVTPDGLPGGRPAPYMCYANAIRLGVFPLHAMVKVGDTVADIREGRNAGMWSVGTVLGGSELGLDEEQTAELSSSALEARVVEVEATLYRAGAHYVIRSMAGLEDVLDDVNHRIGRGEVPQIAAQEA